MAASWIAKTSQKLTKNYTTGIYLK